MSKHLLIAEKIYKKTQPNKRFMQQPVEDMNTLMIEIKNALENTNLKLLYHAIDFENLIMCNSHHQIKLDLTLIPKITNSQEFILWLASFIEKITQEKKTKLPPIKHKIKPSYYSKNQSPIKPVNNGENIVAYFKKENDLA